MKNIYIVAWLFFVGKSVVFSQSKLPPIEKFKLKNGVEILFIEYGNLPITSMSVYVNVGKKTETPGQQYLSELTASSLMLGNSKYSRLQQDSLMYVFGSNFSIGSNKNFTQFNAQFLNDDTDAAMDFISSTLLQPIFPKTEIKLQIEETLNYNNLSKIDIANLASVFSDYVVFSTSNPLGRRFYQAQLREITDAQVQEFYQFNYTPKNTKMVITGKYDKEQMKILIEKYFGSWSAALGEINKSIYESPNVATKEIMFVNKSKVTQAALRWSKKAPSVSSKDYIAFSMVNSVFSTWLMDVIRGKEGKTYGIYSSYNEQENNEIYNVTTQVRTEVMYETTLSFERLLKQFYEKGVSQSELNASKNELKSNFNAIQNPLEVTNFYNPLLYPDASKRNQYISDIDKITIEIANKTIKKYFNPSSYKLVIVGDEVALAEQLSKINGLVKLQIKSVEVDN